VLGINDDALFSAATFSQLFSSFLLFATILVNNILSQFREAEKAVDEVVGAFHELVDVVLVACGTTTTTTISDETTSTTPSPSSTAGAPLVASARQFLRAFVQVLNAPPTEISPAIASVASPRVFTTSLSGFSDNDENDEAKMTKAPSSSSSALAPTAASDPHQVRARAATERAYSTLDAMVREARSFHTATSKPALTASSSSLVAGAAMKCVDRFRRESHRIWTIRRTRVLRPAQLYVRLMLFVVLAATCAVKWPVAGSSVAEFVCVSTSSAAALLIDALIQELDDPFQREGAGLGDGAAMAMLQLGVRAARAVLPKRLASGVTDFGGEEYSGVRVSVSPLLEAAQSRM
jgi:hypothetical protein